MIITEDIAKTILAGCYKFGAATMLRCGGATMTKVIEVYEEDTRQTDRGDNLQGEILPILGGGISVEVKDFFVMDYVIFPLPF